VPDAGGSRGRRAGSAANAAPIHAFTVQEAGLPAGFEGPRVFAIVKIDGLRVFSIVVGAEPSRVALGQPVRVWPLRVADDPSGNARWLPAFRLA